LKKKKNFVALFGQLFLLFCGICTLGVLLNASGPRKYLKLEIFFENVVLWGAFFGPKGIFLNGILRKPANFNI
jgi:hypothetical protein